MKTDRADVLIPVVLSGGAGTRLWPISRAGHPKPFMKLPDGQSLLHKTFGRAAQLAQGGQVITVTNREHFFVSKDEFEKVPGATNLKHLFMLEPAGRNTAAAIALAALWVRQLYGEQAVMLAMPADHLIAHEDRFVAAVAHAAGLARRGFIVTFGAKPDRPDTGFGYIECGGALDDCGGAAVKRFTEKPDLRAAEHFLAGGVHLWNCGIFCFTAATILDELKDLAVDVHAAAKQCWRESKSNFVCGSSMFELSPHSFEQVPSISLDKAVVEKSGKVAVVPCDFGWSDVGSWTAISTLVKPDEKDNRVIGDAVVVDSQNVFVQAEHRMVAVVGLEDVVVVETPDAVLVADRGSAQEVKKVVDVLKSRGHQSYKTHRTVFRPWGSYTVLEEGPNFKIKRIVVKPYAALSLQMHRHRSEHWVVVKGQAQVVNGDHEISVNTNESTYIPAGHKHRLENRGSEDLVLIEVQSGDYLGEDDIVRLSDRYGRVAAA